MLILNSLFAVHYLSGVFTSTVGSRQTIYPKTQFSFVFHTFSAQILGFQPFLCQDQLQVWVTPVTMINYNTLIFWWIAYTTKYYFLIATIVTLNTRLGNRLVLVIFQIFWHPKFDSLYSSFAIYHLSCSSFVFLGIVIVKVCFFPGADFLLNKALVKICQQFSDERQKTSEQNGNRITCESSPCQEQDLSSPCRLDIPS